jgi:hypothetical protein
MLAKVKLLAKVVMLTKSMPAKTIMPAVGDTFHSACTVTPTCVEQHQLWGWLLAMLLNSSANKYPQSRSAKAYGLC